MLMSPSTIRVEVSPYLDQRQINTGDFAKGTEMTYAQALGYVRGVYRRVDLDVLARICDFLDVDPGDIIIREKDSTP